MPHWRSNLNTLATAAGPGARSDERACAGGGGPRPRPGRRGGRNSATRRSSRARSSPASTGPSWRSALTSARPGDRLVDRLLGEQLSDGGWNCEAERGSVRSSFHTTICVLEGLLEYEKAKGGIAAVSSATSPGAGVPAATAHVPAAVIRRGDRPEVDAVHVPDHVALRRAEGLGLHAPRRRRRATNALPRPSGWWWNDGSRTAAGCSMSPTAMPSTTWKAGPASRAAGSPSAPCGCWTGILARGGNHEVQSARGDGGGRG